MNLVTCDMETTYGPGYTLSSMTTEAYVRDPRFEALLCGFKVNDGPSYWVPRHEIPDELARLQLHKCAVLMHHAHFDGLILSHHYGVRPRLILDTLGMARALHGANGGLSLAKLAERYGIGKKGDEVLNARGMTYSDFVPTAEIQSMLDAMRGFTPELRAAHCELHNHLPIVRYGRYCCNDADLTYELGLRMLPQFSREELEVNDRVVRMFTEPVFELDTYLLRQYADNLRAEKVALMLQAGVQVADLMSNAKFALVLEELGVEPPMKISPATGKLTYAFAKTDAAMQALQEHPDERVQILVEARLKNKTTIAEKGAERLIAMGERGAATVYLKYSGASGSHRLSGADGFNWQSMKRGSDLRNSVMAPPGHRCVVGDSSNIEARILDWLAGQDDMVQAYREYDAGRGPDIYCLMAERIYKRRIVKERDPHERQMGKVCIAEGTPVLTPRGLVPVQEILLTDRVWDGVEWVTHDGVICNGYRETIQYQGLTATPDHEVFTNDGRKIPLRQAASEMAKLARTGAGRYPIWFFGDCVFGAETRERAHLREGVLPQFGQYGVAQSEQSTAWVGEVVAPQREDSDPTCWDFGATLRRCQGALRRPATPAVRQLRSARGADAVSFAHGVHPIRTAGTAGGDVCWPGDRPGRQQRTLRTGEPAISFTEGADCQSQEHRLGGVAGCEDSARRMAVTVLLDGDVQVCGEMRDDRRADNRARASGGAREAQELVGHCGKTRVYDIVNAGPRHRFTAANVLVANCKLGLGYGMGAPKFVFAVRAQAKGPDDKPLIITENFSKNVVDVYRAAHPQVKKLWQRGEDALKAIARCEVGLGIDYRGIVKTCEDGLVMPGGLKILYPELRYEKDSSSPFGGEWSFWNGKAREHIYGAKVIENIVQCLARLVVFEQCRRTANELKGLARWSHSVHDEGVFVAHAFEASFALDTLMRNMRTPLPWCESLPLNSEGGIHQRYGKAKH